MTGEDTRVGTVVDEKYTVIDCLGRGGMANVWLARDDRLGKLWAIKEIKPNATGSRGEVMRQALIAEADFMKRLDHPAIPRVVDIVDTGRTVFVVMDYVEGTSLGKLMQLRGGPFEQAQVIDWGIQLCDVLGYLHSCDPPVIYRDMKPANVIVRDDGSVRLIDFGIATQCANGIKGEAGTPGYAPVEQLPSAYEEGGRNRGEAGEVDARSDVYSLGVTIYVLVTGHTPQRSGVGPDAVRFDMRPIREWNPRLSDGLERIVCTATRPAPEERYQTIAEMRYDLEHHEELTQSWRNAQRRKLVRFRRRLVLSGACCLMCVGLMGASSFVRTASYEDLMHEAQTASTRAGRGGVSDAERCCRAAIELEPDRLEPYRRLLGVYVDDYRLDEDEAVRWQDACGGARGLAADPDYARFCLEVGTSFLCYYGIEQGGGSVGNAAIASVGAASAWFDRAHEACERSGGDAGLGDADWRALEEYRIVARFHDEVTRAGREGVAASQTYQSFWQAFEEALARELSSSEGNRSAEGVRVRLCQIGVEALSSPTFLAGFARSGIGEEQARGMLARLRTCLDSLEPFSRVPEQAEVLGPVFAEIRQGLPIAEQNIAYVYNNPVMVAGTEQKKGEDS